MKDLEKMKASEIAAEISAALKRWENDPEINKPRGGRLGTRPYYIARACVSGGRVCITYVNYQGSRAITTAEARAYLAWIRAGNIGQHYAALRDSTLST